MIEPDRELRYFPGYSSEISLTRIETGSFDWDVKDMASSALVNAGSSALANIAFPTKGMSTLKQSDYFAPRTVEGFIKPGKNARSIELGVTGGVVANWIFESFILPEFISASNYEDSYPGYSGHYKGTLFYGPYFYDHSCYDYYGW